MTLPKRETRNSSVFESVTSLFMKIVLKTVLRFFQKTKLNKTKSPKKTSRLKNPIFANPNPTKLRVINPMKNLERRGSFFSCCCFIPFRIPDPTPVKKRVKRITPIKKRRSVPSILRKTMLTAIFLNISFPPAIEAKRIIPSVIPPKKFSKMRRGVIFRF